MSKLKNISVFIIISLITLLTTFLLGELYLSLVNAPANHTWGWRYLGKGTEEVNQFGFRGQEIIYNEGDYVILIIGDSQVESSLGLFEDMPEQRLQHHLYARTGKNVKVFSLAAGGYGQDQQLLALEEYFRDYSANMVVVWETPGNDVWNNMFPTHWPKDGTPKPTFWLDEKGKLRGPKVSYRRFRILSLMDTINSRNSLDELWEQKYFPSAYKPLINYSGDFLINRYVLGDNAENIGNEKTHVGLSLVPVSDRTRYGIRLTNKLLLEMKNMTEENGARFVAFTEDRPDFPLADGVYKVQRGSRSLYIKLSKHQYWEHIAALNDGIDFFIVPVRVKKFMYDYDPHLNERAVDQVMKDTAEELEERMEK